MRVELRMPNLPNILATIGAVPSQLIIDALGILTEERVYRPADPTGGITARQIRYVRGLYAVTALCLVSPQLVLDREPNREADEIDTTDLSWADLEAVYFGYFRGYTRKASAPTPPDSPDHDAGDAGAESAGDNVGD